MQYFVYILVNGVQILLEAMMLLMAARAIVSWITMNDESTLSRFLWAVTEPVVMPVRMLLERFSFFNESPIDLSFLVAMIVLLLIQAVLPEVYI